MAEISKANRKFNAGNKEKAKVTNGGNKEIRNDILRVVTQQAN